MPNVPVDFRPAYCRARVLILGVGNVLFGDDGFGPEVARRLAARHEVPDDVYVMDVGTGVRKILFTLGLGDAVPEEIVIVDAVDGGQGDDRVDEVAIDALPPTKTDDFSLHQVPASNLLHELSEIRGVRVRILACDVGTVPPEIRPGLSPSASRAADEAARRLAADYALGPRPPGA